MNPSACPSCHGLNISHPVGCGRDPKTGELNGTTLPEPTVFYYETDGMAEVRRILTKDDDCFTNAEIDTFKECLTSLEKYGFQLTRQQDASRLSDEETSSLIQADLASEVAL